MAPLPKHDTNKRLRFWISKENQDWLYEEDTRDGVSAYLNQLMTDKREAQEAQRFTNEELYPNTQLSM